MNIGDFLRSGACYLDEKLVLAAGRPLIHYSIIPGAVDEDKHHDAAHPTYLRGIYEIPGGLFSSTFGIDAPDEMDIELAFNHTLRKLGRMVAICDLFVDCVGSKWIVTNRRRKDDMVRGQNRLILTVSRYQESVTTGGKNATAA